MAKVAEALREELKNSAARVRDTLAQCRAERDEANARLLECQGRLKEYKALVDEHLSGDDCMHCGERPATNRGYPWCTICYYEYRGMAADGAWDDLYERWLACRAELDADGWVSVEERLPGPGTWVFGLVERQGALWPMVVYHAGMAETGWWNANDPSNQDEMYAQDVCYWRPLPAPPKEVSDDD